MTLIPSDDHNDKYLIETNLKKVVKYLDNAKTLRQENNVVLQKIDEVSEKIGIPKE